MTILHNIFSNKKQKIKQPIKIIADHREKNSLVISELIKLGFKIEFKQLPVADYLLNSTAIERKTISDFKSSIMNKRLSQQLLEIKQYPQHFLILEGLEDISLYDSGGIHENAFRGFLLSVINDFKVPIIFTLNEKDTAKYISVLTKKKISPEESVRPSKILLTEKEQLQFILEGFPQIGPKTAQKLLKHFETLTNIFTSTEQKLSEIIGSKKAQIIHKLLYKKY